MTQKIYLYCLILYGIFSQGIIATFSEDNIKESSHLLIRNKRLLSKNPRKIVPMSINQVPYVVQIQEHNRFSCMGSILLPQIIITAAHCMQEPRTKHVLSGSTHRNRGIRHNITAYRIHPQYRQLANEVANDLSLLRIDPHIDIIHSPNRPIIMNHGHVPPKTVGQVSSWGCIHLESNGNEVYPNELQSIETPVISQEECHQEHKPQIITDRDICTHDVVEHNRCSFGDSGAPLVIFNRLVGVMAWNRELGGPDIFMNLSHPVYRVWILDHLPTNTLYPESSQRIGKKPCNKQFGKTCIH